MTTSNLRQAAKDAPASSASTIPSDSFRLSVGDEEAVELMASSGSLQLQRLARVKQTGFWASMGLGGVARRTLGICLLLVTVFLWTLSNFLASFIFSDHTYDKPFFLVYVNTSVFAVSLIPMFAKYAFRSGIQGVRSDLAQIWAEHKQRGAYRKAATEDDASRGDGSMASAEGAGGHVLADGQEQLSFRETLVLSLEFCMLWFLANYFASACLEFTSVASVTILTSTSSVWTLVFCALMRVEAFSVRKLVGVMASLVGIVLISTVDLSGESDENRGSFPHKTPGQIAIGDAMAFFSAIVYGMYVTVMKRRLGHEDRVNMKLFFGLVGAINLVLLWPLFFILHWTNVEPFELPPTGTIWIIIIVNSLSSYISDMSWAFAMLLTTPLVVTVGISLTIPLSLIGEMIQYGQYSSFVYWIGAAVVFVSFVFVNHESREDEGRHAAAGHQDGHTV
ncbi:uncharacterized protein UV8b_06862 [Ustilaginoidea virens]|uniref:DUF3955 domain-containing protein n=1 Tax=Ustilaginoidea virens TaxID=1159556 RepID=A0A8E5MK13_USTVR|nr:uncharacterized protein UV8b_06862 [Ustilaginoidea virens]QUC22621.1 hypothetical protein UV8b_06862 [Ustilaginoidea virens]